MNINVYTVKNVAEMLKVSEKTVYSIIRDQQLKCIWVRGQIRITLEHLQEYLGGGVKNEREDPWELV